ncbi:MAG: HAD family hydrolase [Nanoarchaeota archaeon]|nr:HAD family hydrolase [Nanoarchaeota archaeon]MBU4299941.1 HAD family hydrolase [Nanoarchaeota archaeon]MBU4452122.1 HAD family hydrolase [Nanoarchaeota archaeon]MCG2723681.1 HAD family hydrolase [archaeon]
MPQIPVKYVLWDYGNTLMLDPFPEVLEKIAPKCAKELGKTGQQISEKRFIEAWRSANLRINYLHCTHFAQEEPILADALRSLGVTPAGIMMLAPKILQIYRAELEAHIKNEPRNKEIREVLDWINRKGFVQGLFSDDRFWDLRASIGWMNIDKFFSGIVVSDEIGIEKPDPKIFDRLLGMLEAEPKDCAYIGDNPLRDVECAKKKGMFTILYKRPMEESTPWRDYKINPKFLPDAKITSLADLKNILVLKS